MASPTVTSPIEDLANGLLRAFSDGSELMRLLKYSAGAFASIGAELPDPKVGPSNTVYTLIELARSHRQLRELKRVLGSKRDYLPVLFDALIDNGYPAADRVFSGWRRTTRANVLSERLTCLIDRSDQTLNFINGVDDLKNVSGASRTCVSFVEGGLDDKPGLLWRRLREVDIASWGETEAQLTLRKAKWLARARDTRLFMQELKGRLGISPFAQDTDIQRTIDASAMPIVVECDLYACEWSGQACAENLKKIVGYWCSLKSERLIAGLLFAVFYDRRPAMSAANESLRSAIEGAIAAARADHPAAVVTLGRLSGLNFEMLQTWLLDDSVQEAMQDTTAFEPLIKEHVFKDNLQSELSLQAVIEGLQIAYQEFGSN